jgi:protein-S-isoprenylcysteine O-methyltransferase Ste14
MSESATSQHPESPYRAAGGTAAKLPPSVTHFGLNLVALAAVIVTMYVLRERKAEVGDAVFALCAAAAAPIVLLDLLVLRVYRRESTGLDWKKGFDLQPGRVVTKLVGLAFTLGLIRLAYWVFPEYHGKFYDPFYYALDHNKWVLIAVSVVYVALVDGLMREPRDAYWQLGRLVLGNGSDAKREVMKNHFLGWLVKAFFFPLMLVWLTQNVTEVLHFNLAEWSTRSYDFMNTSLYLLDLLFTTVGYALSLRILDTQLRTAEPTMFGWFVALFCYQPFFSTFEHQYVSYGGVNFSSALAFAPHLRNLCGSVILILVGIYVSATIAFGVRFSNLTHRGILTNGPYRYTKHPAYISKNLSWWLISLPFLPVNGFGDAVRHTCALGCINMIYFLRARTEEKHLSRDPTYVAYALWINENGTFAFLGKWFPILKYKPPVDYVPPETAAVAATAGGGGDKGDGDGDGDKATAVQPG